MKSYSNCNVFTSSFFNKCYCFLGGPRGPGTHPNPIPPTRYRPRGSKQLTPSQWWLNTGLTAENSIPSTFELNRRSSQSGRVTFDPVVFKSHHIFSGCRNIAYWDNVKVSCAAFWRRSYFCVIFKSLLSY